MPSCASAHQVLSAYTGQAIIFRKRPTLRKIFVENLSLDRAAESLRKYLAPAIQPRRCSLCQQYHRFNLLTPRKISDDDFAVKASADQAPRDNGLPLKAIRVSRRHSPPQSYRRQSRRSSFIHQFLILHAIIYTRHFILYCHGADAHDI